jgi:hypothetical protein
MDTIIKGLRNPIFAINYLVRETFKKCARTYLQTRYQKVNALAEDWDNLIILDACRYDAFADLHTLPGTLTRRLSTASSTFEWLNKVVGEKRFYDTVYITANPRLYRYEDQFYDVIHAWETYWDEELKVTPPKNLANVTVEVLEKYPNKRIVTHFMQPHIPFIGSFGRSNIGIHDGTTKGVNRASGNEYTENIEPYVLLAQGKIDQEAVEKAYNENLNLVLSEVEDLLKHLNGKTVVTADHGEIFGEIGWPTPKRVYGHEYDTVAKGLLEVPWLEYTNGDRRDVTEEQSKTPTNLINEKTVENRLEALGYR